MQGWHLGLNTSQVMIFFGMYQLGTDSKNFHYLGRHKGKKEHWEQFATKYLYGNM